MNSTSFLIVIVATVLGAIGLYIVVGAGMNASDDFASRLSVNSTEYLRMREKAMAEGHDPTKIKANAARSQRPASYDNSLTSSITSPYARKDSDQNTELPPLTKEEAQALFGKLNEDASKRHKARTEAQAKIDAEAARRGINPSVNNNNSANNDSAKQASNTEPKNLGPTEGNGEYVYTVSDEIRRQLATEEMSDEKREQLTAVLPKNAPKPVRAIDVRLNFDSRNCVFPRNSNSWIGINFRRDSTAIRGSSLNELDELIVLREKCDGTLIVEDYAGAIRESDLKLREGRRDEVKYYLLQRRVPKEYIEFPNQ